MFLRLGGFHGRILQIGSGGWGKIGFPYKSYFFSKQILFNIKLDFHLQCSYFVKTLPLQNEIYRNECERKGFFVKEASIYENILPNIQKYARQRLFPKAYLLRKDILVLEDFSRPQKRLRQMLPHESYTLQHYQLYLEHLADMHAASLAWEFKEKLNIGQQFERTLFELQLTSTNEWFLTGIKVIRPMYLDFIRSTVLIPNLLKSLNHIYS